MQNSVFTIVLASLFVYTVHCTLHAYAWKLNKILEKIREKNTEIKSNRVSQSNLFRSLPN